MSMMLTFRAGKVAALAVLLSLGAACSREQQDWRSAEAADTVQGYSQFVERHPESELVTEARTRVAQLSEDHEWSQASHTDTADAYRQFLAEHPNGKWSQEARIRIQNFALNGLPPAGPPMAEAQGAPGSALPPGGASTSAAAAATARAVAAPGELAQASGAAQPSAHAPAIALSTPYVSSPNPALHPAASPANGASSNAPPNISTAYGVQLGAFTSEGAANSAWQQLTSRFGTQLRGLSAHVVAANTATGTLFRLQAQVGDESRARALCDMLRRQSQACVPVHPN
jgi:cell division septation protein DedD